MDTKSTWLGTRMLGQMTQGRRDMLAARIEKHLRRLELPEPDRDGFIVAQSNMRAACRTYEVQRRLLMFEE